MLLIKNKIRKSLKFILYIHLMVVFVCILTLNGDAQIRDTTPLNKHKVDADEYLRKAKRQKNGAMVSLIMGGIITTAGFIHKKSGGEALEAAAIIIIGAPFILYSIPIFIISANNKNKAELILINEKVFLNQSNLKEYMVSVGIKIKL